MIITPITSGKENAIVQNNSLTWNTWTWWQAEPCRKKPG